MATCHLIETRTDTRLVVHQTGETLVAATTDDAYTIARTNDLSVSYVRTAPVLDPLVVMA